MRRNLLGEPFFQLTQKGWSWIQTAGDEGLSLEATGQTRAPGPRQRALPQGKVQEKSERAGRRPRGPGFRHHPREPPPAPAARQHHLGPRRPSGPGPHLLLPPAGQLIPANPGPAKAPGRVLLGQCLFWPRSSVGVGRPQPCPRTPPWLLWAPGPLPAAPTLSPAHHGSHGSGCGEAARRESPVGPGEQGPSAVADPQG